MLELIDHRLFSFLRKIGEKQKCKILVTSDHATPCKLGTHTDDSVPLLLCDWQSRGKKSFSEEKARKGELGKLYGKHVLKLLL